MSGNSYTERPPNQFIQGHVTIGKENIIFPKLSAFSALLRFAKEARHFLFLILSSITHNASVI